MSSECQHGPLALEPFVKGQVSSPAVEASNMYGKFNSLQEGQGFLMSFFPEVKSPLALYVDMLSTKSMLAGGLCIWCWTFPFPATLLGFPLLCRDTMTTETLIKETIYLGWLAYSSEV